MVYDYYEILKLDRTASVTKVHSSYRQLALAAHPEKHPLRDRHIAKNRFCQINEAYDVLRNPTLRQLYDQLGYEGLTTRYHVIPSYPFGYHYHGKPLRTFEEHFGTKSPFADAYLPGDKAHEYYLYEDIFRERPQVKLPPLVISLEVTLEELFHGNVRELEFSRWIVGPDESTLVENQVVRDVHVLPGLGAGAQIVFENEGNQAENMISSDVVVEIIELSHGRFVREGNDLRMRIEVDLLVALCGGDITLTSIDDTPVRIEETNVIHPGRTRKISSFGMPVPHDLSERGDLYLEYDVHFPQDMDMARRAMIADALRSRPSKTVVPTTLIGIAPATDPDQNKNTEDKDKKYLPVEPQPSAPNFIRLT